MPSQEKSWLRPLAFVVENAYFDELLHNHLLSQEYGFEDCF
ncbi:hypothetical protein vBEcoMWL3_gp158c [Escherichia phage vB_EcoM_WL-3]|nr:hypothetical protein vBEcoMWL3_gp158c [Escherichia phage vB_EcoM_WL-3]